MLLSIKGKLACSQSKNNVVCIILVLGELDSSEELESELILISSHFTMVELCCMCLWSLHSSR